MIDIQKLTDRELDEKINKVQHSITGHKIKLITLNGVLNGLIDEKQSRWVKGLTPEEISDL